MNDNMKQCFDLLYSRIIDTIETTDLEFTNRVFRQIKGPTICVGAGGSSVVSDFASKILNIKNNCCTESLEPRDITYLNKAHWENIFIASYGGKNFGVRSAIDQSKNCYLLTAGDVNFENVNVIKYNSSFPKEKSFISLAATMMPLTVLLGYYVGSKQKLKEIVSYMFSQIESFRNVKFDDVFDVLTGWDTSVASTFLNSTLTEAALGECIIHNKYDFCHGRTTRAYQKENHALIYLKTKPNDLSELQLETAKKLYKNILVLKSDFNDIILDNYNLTLKSLYLSRKIAKISNKDLAQVNHAKLKLYDFEGKM